MRSFITADIDAYYMEALRRYYQTSGDGRAKFSFLVNRPSSLRGSIEIAHKTTRLS